MTIDLDTLVRHSYSHLVHPRPRHPAFLAAIAPLVERARELRKEEVRALLCRPNWRFEIVAHSLASLTKNPEGVENVLGSLPGCSPASIGSAAAVLAVGARGGRIASERVRMKLQATTFPDDLTRAVLRYVREGKMNELSEASGFAARFHEHVPYQEWLWATPHARVLELATAATDAAWKGCERACPSCSATVVAERDLCRCSKCSKVFYASDPGLEDAAADSEIEEP